MNETYALVTGAGKGLGLAFAKELARRGYNIILVALHNEDLGQLCTELKQEFGINAVFFEADLTNTEDIIKLTNWIDANYSTSILINNAGFGGSGEFHSSNLMELDNMILLNIRATTWITHQMIPILKKNKNSYILNVASIASFSPIGYKAVYAASKVYIEYLSKGLNRELRQQGIHVSSLHPGPMKTNAAVIDRIKRQSSLVKMGVEETDYVARKAINRLFNLRSLIVIGKGSRFAWLLTKVLPRTLIISMVSSGVKKEISKSV
jgi:uncharacterized protein